MNQIFGTGRGRNLAPSALVCGPDFEPRIWAQPREKLITVSIESMISGPDFEPRFWAQNRDRKLVHSAPNFSNPCSKNLLQKMTTKTITKLIPNIWVRCVSAWFAWLHFGLLWLALLSCALACFCLSYQGIVWLTLALAWGRFGLSVLAFLI